MVNRRTFVSMNEIGMDVLEFENDKDTTRIDVPIQVSARRLSAIYIMFTGLMTRLLSDRVLRIGILQAYNASFLLRHGSQVHTERAIPAYTSRYRLVQIAGCSSKTDNGVPCTIGVRMCAAIHIVSSFVDSMYMAFSTDTIFQAVGETHREAFAQDYANWFAVEFCPAHSADFFRAKFSGHAWVMSDCCERVALHQKRTVGLFHSEWEGAGMVALCSKSYFAIDGSEKPKYSSKGLSHAHNDFSSEDYKNVLDHKQSGSGTNKGFRLKDGRMHTYTQNRKGLSYLYCKRPVRSDGVTTTPTRL